MMQVGYNYYGKKVLKRLEGGEDLNLILMDVVKELQPFTDQALELALNAMPEVMQKSVDVVIEVLDQLADKVSHDVYNFVLGAFGIEGHPPGDDNREGSSGTGGSIPPPTPPPPGYDWEDVDTTVGETVQEMLDRLKQNAAAYQDYVDTIPSDVMALSVVIKAYQLRGISKHIYNFGQLIKKISQEREYLEKQSVNGVAITQQQISEFLLNISQGSTAAHEQTGYWI